MKAKIYSVHYGHNKTSCLPRFLLLIKSDVFARRFFHGSLKGITALFEIRHHNDDNDDSNQAIIEIWWNMNFINSAAKQNVWLEIDQAKKYIFLFGIKECDNCLLLSPVNSSTTLQGQEALTAHGWFPQGLRSFFSCQNKQPEAGGSYEAITQPAPAPFRWINTPNRCMLSNTLLENHLERV